MGNLCGKESSPDPFSQPGRTVGSAPPPSNSKISSVPKKATIGGPARTLGGTSTAEAGGGGQDADATAARRKAAEAAEARAASASKPKGKLAAQLQEQKKQTRIDTLTEGSKNELLARDADAAAVDRAYN